MFAVNTRLTESRSFPIAGWEAEVGSAGCLNDSVSPAAGLCVSRLAIYIHPEHGSAQRHPVLGTNTQRADL